MRFPVAGLATLLFVWLPALVRAETPDPLRLIPASVDAVAKVENPRALYDATYAHPLFQEYLKIDSIAAFLDTTYIRRVQQLLAYFERELGRPRLELLDSLAGGGTVVAANFEKKAVLVVIQAKDENLLKTFVSLSRKILDQELARQEAKQQLGVRRFRDLETWHLGKELHAARAGSALVFSNQESALHAALDSYLDKKTSLADLPLLKEIKKHLPREPLIWGTLNLENVRKYPNVKNTLNTLGLDPISLFTIGGVVDIVKRSPYLCAGLAREGDNLHLRVAMPSGRQGMAPLAAMFLPDDERGSLPMLQPPRVLGSTSYFLDLGNFWEKRHKILTPEQAKGMDKFETQTKTFLKGVSLGTLLSQAGKYQRLVVAVPDKSPYKIKPTIATGSFAVVLDTRGPGFAKSMETVLRGAALLGTFQFGVKMVDEKYKDHTLVTYYFSETAKVAVDEGNVRFNFSPCFTQVGNQFVISSTVELGKDLVDCLLKESKEEASPATQRTHVYARGVAANLRTSEDLLLAQAILSQALPADGAKKQFEQLIQIVERLGQLQLESRYGAQDYHFDIRWQFDKN